MDLSQQVFGPGPFNAFSQFFGSQSFDFHTSYLVLNKSNSLPYPHEFEHAALESRVLSSYVAAASALVIVLQAAAKTTPGRHIRNRLFGTDVLDLARQTIVPTGTHVSSHGGWTILSHQIIRLLSNAALLVLAVYTSLLLDWKAWGDAAVVIASSYAFVLSALLLYVPVIKSQVVSFHATLVTSAIFGAYAYRDLWPSITFAYTPADAREGWFLWTKIALAAVGAIVVPMLEPYPYIPLDPSTPQKDINPEQTASLLSLLTFSFLDPVIWQASKVAHMTADMLPPQVETDNMSALRPKVFRYLDPFASGTHANVAVYRALLVGFAESWVVQVIYLVLLSVAIIASPVGVNKLLSFIENKGDGAFIQPWVWILVITFAPLLRNTCEQLYTYNATRTGAQIEALITAVIYEHSLRVRVLNQAAENTPPTPLPTPPETPKGDTELESTQASGSSEPLAGEESALHARGDTSVSTSSTVVGSSNGKDIDGKGKAEEDNLRRDKSQDVIGKLNNLVTSDLDSINGGKDWLFVILNHVLQLSLGSWFLYTILGWSAWVGLATMVALSPIPAFAGNLQNGVQTKKMDASDDRVSYIKEVLSILRMVKQFGWEPQVQAQIDAKREQELYWVFRGQMLGLVSLVANSFIPLVHMIVTFAIYTLVQKQPLTASVVFSAVTTFDMLRQAVFYLVFEIPTLIQANVSIGRVQDFLNDTELLDSYTADHVIRDTSNQHQDDIGLAQASFFWSREHRTAANGMLAPPRQEFQLRIEDAVVFKKGAVNLIVGPTGSGKTSLIMALLGEMHYVPAGPGGWVNIPKKDGVAYCAQEAWIQSMSIKENILFGAPYDEARYKKVIHQCGLKRDLALFDAGDHTEIGEKGLTLSGGQKARVSLARAVYSSAQVLLLDDILAALDVHTSVWIVNKCLKGELLQGRTVILVTHNVALTTPVADNVVTLDSDGRIISQGAPAEAIVADEALAAEIAHEQEAIELEEELEEQAVDTKVVAQGSKLVMAEEAQEGHVSWKAISLLVSNLSSWPLLWWFGYLAGCCINEAAAVYEIYWLGVWADRYLHLSSDKVNVAYYLGIYCAIVIFIVSAYVWTSGMSSFAQIRVSRVIHAKLTGSLLSSTFRWLDTTPTSRIIARCTQDIQSIDGSLVWMMSAFIGMFIMCLSRLVAVAFSAPAFILPGVALGGLGGLLGQIYIKAQLSVKRERSIVKAPVVATINDAFSGLTSIRAYGAQATFTQHSMDKIDAYTRVSIVYWNINRWVAVRIQTLSAAFAGGLTFYLVYGPNGPRSASSIGFTLNMAVAFGSQLLSVVRIFNMAQVESNSLERVQAYLDIEKEPEPKEGGTPPAYWPASGTLVVKDLTARYSQNGPAVLNKVSFEIKAGERVGIVGRTGSGKSTLTLALLRCIFTEGEMYYDGIPTAALNLDALRSNITIIPQAPELLSGTLRKNVDMFGEHDDQELNDALRSAGLFSLQSNGDDGRLTLDSQIAAGGGNLSVGQRQIIALARALVRQSKLLVLDEATSAIDYETDAVIQSSLRTKLKKDVTVITVAHRLQTVMDSDKIMVLDAGKLVEFDGPKNLLHKEGSLLRALVHESSDKEALHALAEGQGRPTA